MGTYDGMLSPQCEIWSFAESQIEAKDIVLRSKLGIERHIPHCLPYMKAHNFQNTDKHSYQNLEMKQGRKAICPCGNGNKGE